MNRVLGSSAVVWCKARVAHAPLQACGGWRKCIFPPLWCVLLGHVLRKWPSAALWLLCPEGCPQPCPVVKAVPGPNSHHLRTSLWRKIRAEGRKEGGFSPVEEEPRHLNITLGRGWWYRPKCSAQWAPPNRGLALMEKRLSSAANPLEFEKH